MDAPEHGGLYALYRDLLRLRRRLPALRPGRADPRVAHDATEGWITLELSSEDGAPLLALFNTSETERSVPAATKAPGAWRLALSTEAEKYGGQGGAPACLPDNGGATATVLVPATSASVYAREDGR